MTYENQPEEIKHNRPPQGEIIIRHETLRLIHEHTEHARGKRLWPVVYPDAKKFRAVEREIHEMAAAMLKGDRRGTVKEALDAIAVLVRIVEGD